MPTRPTPTPSSWQRTHPPSPARTSLPSPASTTTVSWARSVQLLIIDFPNSPPPPPLLTFLQNAHCTCCDLIAYYLLEDLPTEGTYWRDSRLPFGSAHGSGTFVCTKTLTRKASPTPSLVTKAPYQSPQRLHKLFLHAINGPQEKKSRQECDVANQLRVDTKSTALISVAVQGLFPALHTVWVWARDGCVA